MCECAHEITYNYLIRLFGSPIFHLKILFEYIKSPRRMPAQRQPFFTEFYVSFFFFFRALLRLPSQSCLYYIQFFKLLSYLLSCPCSVTIVLVVPSFTQKAFTKMNVRLVWAAGDNLHVTSLANCRIMNTLMAKAWINKNRARIRTPHTHMHRVEIRCALFFVKVKFSAQSLWVSHFSGVLKVRCESRVSCLVYS